MKRNSSIFGFTWAILMSLSTLGEAQIPRLHGGTPTSNYPTALVQAAGSDVWHTQATCGGVLIGCDTVLVAAHCNTNTNVANKYVFLQHAGFFKVASQSSTLGFDKVVYTLTEPVTGISPSPINGAPCNTLDGMKGTIVAWGDAEGAGYDPGVKKAAAVSISSSNGSACSSFGASLSGSDRADVNDSGSPIFVDGGTNPILSGIVYGAGGSFQNLTISSTAEIAPQLEAMAAVDPSHPSCGDLVPVGEAGTDVVKFSGILNATTNEARHSFKVNGDKVLLRVGVNSQWGSRDKVFVRAGEPPTPTEYDCLDEGDLELGFCEVSNPTEGTWHVLVQRTVGAGRYQLTLTAFEASGFCGNPSNDGLPCDDGNDCTTDSAGSPSVNLP